jgi:hypothetical protein
VSKRRLTLSAVWDLGPMLARRSGVPSVADGTGI